MANLRRVPTLVYLVLLVATVLTAASIGGAQWFEAAENQRVAAGGGANQQVGLAYAFFAGYIPVMVLLAAGITSGIFLAKRIRARQDAGLTPAGWGNRAGVSLGMLLLLFAIVSVVVWLLWFAVHLVLLRNYGSAIIGEAGMAGTFPTVLGLIFGPGMTGGLPAVLMTASAPTEEEENA
ncbi:hypothetical protein [Gulosibacter chungangensis]|uniref:Uncharacterized protein n=1 Tax=Gulosibacter chungangensis TaxID=979746 RepID=A0A7J5BCG5_9MICO|nr:hypothetical protein [Gulosibacter chungangensis]KAB1643248.1 hypothetical protein F8O05_08505 [Gulosibacter chungangensis]